MFLEKILGRILPVVEGGNKAKTINACILNSPLWDSVEILNLRENMRIKNPSLDDLSQPELSKFSDCVLAVGDGQIPSVEEYKETDPTSLKFQTIC